MQSLRKIPFLLAVMISLLLAGCWDLKEINEIGFTVGLGIDKDGDDYQITTQIALPALLEGSGGGEEPPVWVVSGKGRTIFEAIRDVNTRSARKPFWGHLNVIVLGEEVAREGLIPVLDLLSRGQELRRSNYVVLAQGKARDILEAQPKLESINAIYISHLVENRIGQSVAPAVTINDLLITLSTSGKENVLPRITALEQESFRPPPKEKEKAEEGEEKPKEILELRGSGFFKGDKLIGWLDEETTRGYLWVQGEVRGGVIVVENPVEPEALVSLEIKGNKSRIKPRFEKDKIKIDININSSFNLVENAGSVSFEEKDMDHLRQKAGEAVKKEVEKAIQKAQETKSDFLGLGEYVRVGYPHVWEGMEWSEVFPNIEINVLTNVEIQEAAMTLKPITTPSQRTK